MPHDKVKCVACGKVIPKSEMEKHVDELGHREFESVKEK